MASSDFRPPYQSGSTGGGLTDSSDVDAALVPLAPNAAIDLAADDVEEAITELATELYDIENMPSLSLNYNLQRNS